MSIWHLYGKCLDCGAEPLGPCVDDDMRETEICDDRPLIDQRPLKDKRRCKPKAKAPPQPKTKLCERCGVRNAEASGRCRRRVCRVSDPWCPTCSWCGVGLSRSGRNRSSVYCCDSPICLSRRAEESCSRHQRAKPSLRVVSCSCCSVVIETANGRRLGYRYYCKGVECQRERRRRDRARRNAVQRHTRTHTVSG